MNQTEEEASVRSRQSVHSLPTMGDAQNTESEAQRRRTACAWARSERALDGEREQIHADVVKQSVGCDGMDSLWRAMNVIEGGQGTSAEAKEIREKVVAAVEERRQAGEMQEALPQGKAGWQAYVRKLLQGRRMGGPLEVEASGVRSGYRMRVYRETNDGTRYRKCQEYGGEKGVSVGILWRKRRVYEVVWGQEEAVNISKAREGGGEGLCSGAQARMSMGSRREHSVASSESQRSTCGPLEFGEYRGEQSRTATQGSMGLEEERGGIRGNERKDRGRGANRAHVQKGCQVTVGGIVCTGGQAGQ